MNLRVDSSPSWAAWVGSPSENEQDPSLGAANPIKFVGDLPEDQWVKFVIGWKADPTGGNGWVRVWRDGILRYTYNGTWGYSTAVTSKQSFTFKIGLYGSPAPVSSSQQIWFDDMRYGDSLSAVDN